MRNFRVLILFVIFLVTCGCRLCMNECEIDELSLREPYENYDLQKLNGVYFETIYSPFRDPKPSICSTFIRNGVIKTQNFGVIHIKNLKDLGGYADEFVYEFEDGDKYYQIYLKPESIHIVGINLWMTLTKKIKKEKKK